MKDRISTQVLANGAIRYAEYDAQGNFVAYHYMLAADEPSVAGTPLNKATFLKDSTASALSLGSNPTVDDALNALKSYADRKSKIATGSYVGTGTYGSSNPNTITFEFVPKFFFISKTITTISSSDRFSATVYGPHDNFTIVPYSQMVEVWDASSSHASRGSMEFHGASVAYNASSFFSLSYSLSNNHKTLSWYANTTSSPAESQLNESGSIYTWIAIG